MTRAAKLVGATPRIAFDSEGVFAGRPGCIMALTRMQRKARGFS